MTYLYFVDIFLCVNYITFVYMSELMASSLLLLFIILLNGQTDRYVLSHS